LLTRYEKLDRALAIGADKADPVMLEVFNNLFMSIAEQMGVTLQNTAYSVNIKERLDFSCAVFDRTGALVANAPHMPVHLGSMDRSVETIIRLNEGDIHPGDVLRSTPPTMAAPTCPISPWSRRCSPMMAARSCSGSPRAATTPMSAAWRPVR
jgi:5-oxoprolinase (ATP-hydrolysing)